MTIVSLRYEVGFSVKNKNTKVVYDLNLNELWSGNMTEDRLSINLSHQPAGLYLVKLMQVDGTTEVLKLFIK